MEPLEIQRSIGVSKTGKMRPESADTIRIDPENHNQVNAKPIAVGMSTINMVNHIRILRSNHGSRITKAGSSVVGGDSRLCCSATGYSALVIRIADHC